VFGHSQIASTTTVTAAQVDLFEETHDSNTLAQIVKMQVADPLT
jgi:hypothetical protein